jgi:hypothetical protein
LARLRRDRRETKFRTLQDTAGKRTFAAANASVGGCTTQKKAMGHNRRKAGNSFMHGAGEARDTSALARVCQQ